MSDNLGQPFELAADFVPTGDQPKAIRFLCDGLRQQARDQVLLGVTGSGKTFTMAHIIHTLGRPALILAHNKTLAGQLYGEMKRFFPHNAVEYFVSYYDYYQPEAYIPRSDTYIEKDATINEQIDRMRHAATRALLTRRDAIIIASVSCIYGLGSPESYRDMAIDLATGQQVDQQRLLRRLVEMQYQRNDTELRRSTFRVRGDTLEIFPAHEESRIVRVVFFGDEIEQITEVDALTGKRLSEVDELLFFPASHYVTRRTTLLQAMASIQTEAKERVQWFHDQHREVEAQRLESRVRYDLEMMQESGYCNGIENYSRYLSGRAPGQPPPTLMEYLPKDALLFVDESHVTLPQLRGMFRGDRSRKETLVDYGFRLPSALDNRPLTFEEWDGMRPCTIYVSATPAPLELERSGRRLVEQIIRPTGLLDPVCEVRPAASQVDDLIGAIRATLSQGHRVLVTTLTKKMAESLTEYLQELQIAVRYLHSDIDTLERMAIVHDLRAGLFHVLVGINLLREGLDIPEVALVAILDADKEGFLRSDTSLVQTIGRAARNAAGHVILYADQVTGSMQRALDETNRRRQIQQRYNHDHGLTPASIHKAVDPLPGLFAADTSSNYGHRKGQNKASTKSAMLESDPLPVTSGHEIQRTIQRLEQQMQQAAAALEFERAASYRDQILLLDNHKKLSHS
ncbi:MAG: excinuclease ABC subunit UvrB [Magnetococcales bacterium]|nr:excinuclease ABC subunit UvrB [Magnetococcales bacterium]